MLASSCGAAVVVDDAGRYRGVLDIDRLMRVMSEMRAVERVRDRGIAEAPHELAAPVPGQRAATDDGGQSR